MAEAVVSVALETFRDLLMEEGRFLSGVGKEVKALETQLKEMKCLLEDADRRRHESKSVSNWIVEIRDLAHRAEDVIETYAVQVSTKRARGFKNLLRRFSCIIMSKFYSLHRIASQISQIKSDLESVRKSMQDYGIRSIIQGETSTSSTTGNQQWKRQTYPDFEIQDCFVGKDDELKRIVDLLVNDGQHRVVSIWGMCGLGKTTIARRAYNHVDTKRCFQSFAWVCITHQCQIRSVLEDVLRQLNPQKRDVIPSLSNAELIEEVCQIQKAKPCIIVLDDLWEIDHWDGVKHAFLVEGVKSKILVTTRKQRVAEIGFSIQLGLLSSDSGWELLKMKAFPGKNIPDSAFEEKQLPKIGREMVQKCGFLPLTICLLGGVLSKRKSMREWELVNKDISEYLYMCDNIGKENEIHAMLNLSYEDLPYYLKPCFLYLSLYKEDQTIGLRVLYNMWIAQGMISHRNREDESLYVIAQLYLSELASRSIVQVQVFDEDSKSRTKYKWCKLHDVVRELCLSMGKTEGFGLQSLNYVDGKLIHGTLAGVKTRHLVVHFEGENEAQVDGGELTVTGDENDGKHVRSLLLLNSNDRKIEFLYIGIDLQNFKLLRVLFFLGLKFGGRKLPKGIGNLIHLRYLCFEECELDELPSTIRNLSYLQTLDLTRSWDVRLPNVFNKLLRLKNLILPLYSSENYALQLDTGLDELETLYGFDGGVQRLDSITRLKNLRAFDARVRDIESLSEVIDAITTKWNKLQFCSVKILKGCEFASTERGSMILKDVFICPKIDELGIGVGIGKQLNHCRNYASSSNIKRLILSDSEIEDDPMDILGKLPVLRELFLVSRSFIGKEMECPALSFPRLTLLSLCSLPNLREWRVEEAAMPLLSEIEIEDCPDLIMLPDGLRFISSLQKLTIKGMPSLGKRVLASEEDIGGGEDFNKVRHVPSIIIDN